MLLVFVLMKGMLFPKKGESIAAESSEKQAFRKPENEAPIEIEHIIQFIQALQDFGADPGNGGVGGRNILQGFLPGAAAESTTTPSVESLYKSRFSKLKEKIIKNSSILQQISNSSPPKPD